MRCLSAWLLAASLALVDFALSGCGAFAAIRGREPVQLEEGVAPGISSRDLPSQAERLELVQDTIKTFAVAVTARNMEALHSRASATMRVQLPPEALAQIFSSFYPVASRLDALAAGQPVISSVSVRPASGGAFTIEGYYPAGPQNLSFRMTYVREGLAWWWSYLHVSFEPSDISLSAKSR